MTDDGRHGKYITTILNTRLYLTDMRPQDLDPRFIACGLARECRWSCQLFEFYPVAQHCWLVNQLVDRWYEAKTDAEIEHKRIMRAYAHTHDVTEALGLRDVAAGFKESDELAGYRACEERASDVVTTWLDLPRKMPLIVHRADMVVRAAEARDLRKGLGYSGSLHSADDVPTIVPWPTHYAEARWLLEFNALFWTNHRPGSPKAQVYFDRLVNGIDDMADGSVSDCLGW